MLIYNVILHGEQGIRLHLCSVLEKKGMNEGGGVRCPDTPNDKSNARAFIKTTETEKVLCALGEDYEHISSCLPPGSEQMQRSRKSRGRETWLRELVLRLSLNTRFSPQSARARAEDVRHRHADKRHGE